MTTIETTRPLSDRVLDAFPSGSYALHGLLQVLEIVESEEVPTAATECRVQPRMLINPRFEVSFWGMEHALPLMGKRANLPVACLPLLAALTPEGHTVTLIDENVEAIDWERCARADIVGVTGMGVQRHRMTEVLTEWREALAAMGAAHELVLTDQPYTVPLRRAFDARQRRP